MYLIIRRASRKISVQARVQRRYYHDTKQNANHLEVRGRREMGHDVVALENPFVYSE